MRLQAGDAAQRGCGECQSSADTSLGTDQCLRRVVQPPPWKQPRAATRLVGSLVQIRPAVGVLTSLRARVPPMMVHGVLPIGGPIAHPHLDGADESSPKSLPKSPEYVSFERCGHPDLRQRHCRSLSNCVKLHRVQLQNGTETLPQPSIVGSCESATHSGRPGQRDSVQENVLLLQHGLQLAGHKISVTKRGSEHFDALFVGRDL